MTINYKSLQAVIGSATQQVMVYGSTDCDWEPILVRLQHDPTGPIKKVFDFHVGQQGQDHVTLEGRSIHKITSLHHYKSALVNLVFENIRRQREGLPLIPILFLIDKTPKTSDFYPLSVSTIINTRNKSTLQELRRAYKLCEDTELPPEARAVANQTFRFARVEIRDKPSPADVSHYCFTQVNAPWQGQAKTEWDKEWAAYKAGKAAKIPLPYENPSVNTYADIKRINGWHWKPQLLEAIARLASSPSYKQADLRVCRMQ